MGHTLCLLQHRKHAQAVGDILRHDRKFRNVSARSVHILHTGLKLCVAGRVVPDVVRQDHFAGLICDGEACTLDLGSHMVKRRDPQGLPGPDAE